MPRATKSAGLNAKAKRKERREEKFNKGGEGGAATTTTTTTKEDEEGGNKQKKKHKGNQHEDADNNTNKKSKNTSLSFKSSNASGGNGDKKAWKSGGIGGGGGGSGGFKKTASSQQQQTQSQSQKQGFAKPNFQLIEELVLIFEKLRQTKDSSKTKNGGGSRGKGKGAGDDDDDNSDNDNNSRDAGKKKEYATLIYSKIKGKIPEIANNHKGSRIVQSLLKYGTEEQINSVFAECAPKLAILAKSLYGNFLIRKLIEKTKKEDYPQLLQNVKGQVTSLARHPVGSQILEHLYHSAKGEQRAQMQAEFYGGEFVHFSNASAMTKKDGKNTNKEPPTLKDILLQKPAMQRQNTLKNISRSILPILEKGLVSPLIVHKVVKEYLLVGGASLRAEAANSIAAPAFLRLFHTREGATATNVMLSYAGAKQRKQVLKALKTQVWRVSQDECAHSTIMTLIDCVDDTNMLNKIILQELKSEDIAGIVCEHKFGKRVILHLLRPRLNKYSPPNLQMMMLSPEEIHQSVEAAKALVKTLQKQQKKINRHDNDGDDGEEEIEDDEILKDSSNKKSEGNKRKLSSDGGSDSEEDEEEAEGADVNFGVAKKSEQQRRLEVFKQYGFAEALVKSCQDNIDRMLRSKESGDVLYEVIIGGLDDVMHESCGEGKMNAFYERIAEVVTESIKSAKADEEDNLLENFFSTRLLRRAAQDCPRFAKVLFDSSVCASSSLQKKWLSMPHAEKIIAGVLSCSDEKFVTEAKAKMGADADAILAKVIAKKEKHRDNAAKGKS